MTIDPSQLLRNAKLAVREKDVDKAWQLLHEYIIERPDDINAWLMLGGLSKPDNRLVYIQRAEELAPEDPRVRKALIWARGLARREETRQREESDLALTAPHQAMPQEPVGTSAVEQTPVKPKTAESEFTEPIPAVPEPSSLSVPVVAPLAEPAPQSFPTVADKVEVEGGKPKSKPLKWLQTLFTLIFLAVVFFLLGTGVYAMVTGTEPNVFGYQMMMVTSGSMEPTFMTGSIVVVNTNEGQDYDVGDVAMFWTPDDPERNITHRIIAIAEQDGQRYYQTQGDNNNAPDQELITLVQIRGKYANFTIPYLGYFFSFIKSRDGILFLAVLLGLYLVITQAIRIRKLMKEDAENAEGVEEEG